MKKPTTIKKALLIGAFTLLLSPAANWMSERLPEYSNQYAEKLAPYLDLSEHKVTAGVESPYSKQEIELMMKYHGSMIAKMENGQWYCLQGKRWIKITNAHAQKFARLHLAKETVKD